MTNFQYIETSGGNREWKRKRTEKRKHIVDIVCTTPCRRGTVVLNYSNFKQCSLQCSKRAQFLLSVTQWCIAQWKYPLNLRRDWFAHKQWSCFTVIFLLDQKEMSSDVSSARLSPPAKRPHRQMTSEPSSSDTSPSPQTKGQRVSWDIPTYRTRSAC